MNALTYTDAITFWNDNKHLSEHTSGTAHCYTSGRFRATHWLADGRVVELWENALGFLGQLQWAFVFDSMDDWNAHDHFPHNIKYEVGL